MKRSAWIRGLHLFMLGAALTGCRGLKSENEVVRRPPSYPTYQGVPQTQTTQTTVASAVITPGPATISHPVDSGSIVIAEHTTGSASDETSVTLTAGGDRVTISATVPTPPAAGVVQASVTEARPAEVPTSVAPRKSFVDVTAQPCFAHAPDYTWISGQLVHFGRTNKWQLRYLSVDEADNYGGSVTLIDEGQLQNFQEGQYVRVEGVVGQGEHGRAPIYQISSIKLIDKPDAAPAQP